MTKRIQVFYVVLLVVVSFRFFEARFLNENITSYFIFFYISSAIALAIPFVRIKGIGFILPIQLLVFSQLVSMVMAYITWGQGLMDTLLVTVPLMLWFFFFYLLHIKFPVKTIEGIIVIYGIIYILIFFYQFTHSHTVLFGWREGFLEERGSVRIFFQGGGIFFLSSFLALNKLTTQKRGKFLWMTLTIFGMLIPFLQATRQFIAGVLLIYLFHLIKDLNLLRKLIILTSFIGLLFYFSRSDNDIIKGILEAQEETLQEGKENIRIRSAAYFITEFSRTSLNRLLGNGVPHENVSDYGKFVEDLKQEGYYLSDVGIISVYVMFGIMAVIAYILIWVKSFTYSLSNEYYYLKYYLWFLLITCLTSDNIYSYGYLIPTVFVLYIFQTFHLKQLKITSKIRR